MSVTDPHTLAGAYAVHALGLDERAAFDEHLARCAECRQQVAEFAATAGRLALAVSATARPVLKQRALEEITGIRQQPPRTLRETCIAVLPRSAPLRGFLVAASLAAAAVGGVATWQAQEARQAGELAQEAQARTDQVVAVLAAGDARTHAASLPEGARGVVVTSAGQDRAVFTASGLGVPPEGRVYELWFDDAGTMRPAGLLDRDRTDQVTALDGTIARATGMAITVEPAGGSGTPTLPPVGLIGFGS
ncbi:anti-sigma factor domain-containing protein [Streptomyces sp. SYP-A7185]|uniref:anti-sigma factor n=1 Tax=Streptomyces sp. SYP-A7185 TaxID=3040076 RepID=UPI0038F6C628